MECRLCLSTLGRGDATRVEMVDRVKGGICMHPPPSPAWAELTIMMECTPKKWPLPVYCTLSSVVQNMLLREDSIRNSLCCMGKLFYLLPERYIILIENFLNYWIKTCEIWPVPLGTILLLAWRCHFKNIYIKNTWNVVKLKTTFVLFSRPWSSRPPRQIIRWELIFNLFYYFLENVQHHITFLTLNP